jgi:AMP nucleosidase
MPFMPPLVAPTFHHDAESALAQVRGIYSQQINHLREAMQRFVAGETMPGRVRGCYPFVRIHTDSVVPQAALENAGLSYGFVASAGGYETTLTRPDLYGNYYLEQFRLLLQNHGVPLEVGVSDEPMPIHFSFAEHDHIEGNLPPARRMMMRDLFDLPDLSKMDDGIANGTLRFANEEAHPLSLFTASRVDYSLHRLRHYTGSTPDWFQNFVLFTNYQFYIDEFIKLGHEEMNRPDSEYIAFVEPGNVVTRRVGLPREPLDSLGAAPPRLPQMPAYHLIRPGHGGLTMVNIGVGPANAKNITDHVRCCARMPG